MVIHWFLVFSFKIGPRNSVFEAKRPVSLLWVFLPGAPF